MPLALTLIIFNKCILRCYFWSVVTFMPLTSDQSEQVMYLKKYIIYAQWSEIPQLKSTFCFKKCINAPFFLSNLQTKIAKISDNLSFLVSISLIELKSLCYILLLFQYYDILLLNVAQEPSIGVSLKARKWLLATVWNHTQNEGECL